MTGRLRLATIVVAVLGWAATASAVPVGFSWDSPGPCSAPTIVAGTPCVLNEKARVAAAEAGNAIEVLDLFQRAITTGLLGRRAGTYDFKLEAEFTDNWAIGEFGWFDVGTAAAGVIFAAGQVMGATARVELPAEFRFYYRNVMPGAAQYFEDFIAPRQFWFGHDGPASFVGVEDIASPFITPAWTPFSSDYDYNDLVVSFEATEPVPEPATILLFGAGLVGIARRLRRRRD